MSTKKVIIAVLSFVLSVACGFELYSAASNLIICSPLKVSPAELNVTRTFEQWFGGGRTRHKETVSMATIDGNPTLIIGTLNQDGWVLPSIHPEIYRSEMEQPDSSVKVLKFYRFHPFLRYALGGAVCGMLFLLSVSIFINCLRSSAI